MAAEAKPGSSRQPARPPDGPRRRRRGLDGGVRARLPGTRADAAAVLRLARGAGPGGRARAAQRRARHAGERGRPGDRGVPARVPRDDRRRPAHPATLHRAVSAFGSVASTSSVQVAPAPPLAPLMLAGVTAVWTAAFAAHALAFRARSPLLASLPRRRCWRSPGIVLGDGARPLYVSCSWRPASSCSSPTPFGASARGGRSAPGTGGVVRSGGGTTARGAWRVARVHVGGAVPAVAPPRLRAQALLSLRGGRARFSLEPDRRHPAAADPEPGDVAFTVQRPADLLADQHPRHVRREPLDSSRSLTGGPRPTAISSRPSSPRSRVNANTTDADRASRVPQPCPRTTRTPDRPCSRCSSTSRSGR